MERKKLGVEKEVEAEPGLALHNKYRPKALADVYGHTAVVKSLKDARQGNQHTFLFTGPAGVGKTSLARIMAHGFGCDDNNIVEVDAALDSKVEEMRALAETLQYTGFGKNPNKAFIIDECQHLSASAWGALLKSTEEPPQHVYFFFCSTAPAKIPKTIVTRAQAYDLKPLGTDDIMDLLEFVCKAEDFDTSEMVLDLVARACEGSPRQALTMLAKVHNCKDLHDVDELLALAGENKEVIELCRLLVQGKLDWTRFTATLKDMGDVSAETIRAVVVNYLNSCLMASKTKDSTVRLLNMLECFVQPYNPTDKMAPIFIAFGRWIYP